MSNVPTNLIPSTLTQLPEYQGSSTLGYFAYSLEGRSYKVQFANLASVGAVPSTRVIAAGTGLTGGGDLSQDRVISIANGGVGTAQLANSGVVAGTYGSGSAVPVLTVDAKGRVTTVSTAPLSITGYVPDSRTITTGAGLLGGGSLASNLTITVDFYSSAPQALGSASAGVSNAAARGDHVHPAVDLSDNTQTQGALPLGRGGTGDALSPVAGAVVYSTGTKFALADPGIPGQVFTSDGAGEPYWQTVSGTGTVTDVSVVTANGFAGAVANSSTIPAITISTTVTGLLKGNGTAISAAIAGVDYASPGANSDITSLSGITGGIGTPDYIDFDTGATPTRASGRLWWDNSDSIQTLNLGMAGSNATLQIGEEMYFRVKASSAITEGQVVMFTGTVGGSGGLTAAPATGLTKDTASYVMGVATESITLNGWGYVTQFGLVRGINTTGGAEAWVDGQILYYNPAVPGGLTKTVPAAPAAKVEVAAVVNAASGGSGSLFIRPAARFSLTQLNDVESSAAVNTDLLQYNGSLWQHKSPSTISVGTATNLAGGAANRIAYQTGAGATGFITAPTVSDTYLNWSGSAFQWTANPLGTVTSVAASGGTTGLTFSGSPITTSGTLTLGGTLGVANGGTGATTLSSGYLVKGNGTSAVSASVVYDNGTNVGIGTSTPAQQFHVNNTSGDAISLITGGTGFSGNLFINGGRSNLTGALRITSFSGGNAEITNASNSNLLLGTNNAERMRIDASGNVGLGTSSPGYRLEVNGRIAAQSSSDPNLAFVLNNTATGGREWQLIGSATGGLNGGGTFNLRDNTAGANRLTLDATGNLGLGVAPSAWGSSWKAFEQVGGSVWSFNYQNLSVSQNAFHNGTNYIYKNTSAATDYQQSNGVHIWRTAPSGTAGAAVSFTQAMTLDASGNLGVGTSSPRNPGAGYKGITLDGSTSGFLDLNTNGTRILTVFGSTNDIVFSNPTATGSMGLYTNNTERLRIDSSGNVGIGTSSPSTKLDVSGVVKATAFTGIDGGTF